MKRILVAIALTACTREDGEPDPPVQVLVPCDPAAPAGDPLACPVDAGVDAPAATPRERN
jgi:hypothetical protein